MTLELSRTQGVPFKFRGIGRRRQYAFVPQLFGIFTLFLLSGYALFGRGFAYIGVPPIFVGEVGLCLAAATFVAGFHRALWQTSLTWLLVAFMLWGAACTVPYVDEYGLDALRDAAVWAYALYAIAVATALLRLNAIEKVIEFYGSGLRVFLILAPILFAVFFFFGSALPRWPWGPIGGVTIINVKVGDLAVHYSGVFVFILLGLLATRMQPAWISLWLAGVAPVAMLGRAPMLTVALVVFAFAVIRPTLKYYYVVMLALFLLFVFYAGNIDLGVEMGHRQISIDQLWMNLQSIFAPSERLELDLEWTKRWRELWWQKIIDYTVLGDYFWMGKGFGINLADADGFQVAIDHSLRSPHNVHMAILARSGIPGMVLWIALQFAWALGLFLNYLKDQRAGRLRLAKIEIWVLLYWLAFIINGTFDVFLEGPQGGIWFWSVFGFGLALMAGREKWTASAGAGVLAAARPPDRPIGSGGRKIRWRPLRW